MATVPTNALVLVDGYDLSSYLKSVKPGLEIDALDVTTFTDAPNKAFVSGIRGGTLALEGFYKNTPGTLNGSEDVLGAAFEGTQPKVVTVALVKRTLGEPVVMVYSRHVKYEIGNSIANLVMITAELEAVEDTVERGLITHPLAPTIGTAATTLIDNLTPTSNGGVAHLHITAVGGLAIITVQHSADSVNWIDLAAFAPTSVVGTQRVEFTGTVFRYIQAAYSIATSPVTFAVAVARR